MKLTPLHIDLHNVPAPQLKKAAKQIGVKKVSKMSKPELVRRLASLNRTRAEQLTDGYLYAGSTSIKWYRLAKPLIKGGAGPQPAEDDELPDVSSDEDPRAMLTAPKIARAKLRKAVQDLGGVGAYSETDLPLNVDWHPQLVFARNLDGTTTLLSMVAKRRVQEVVHNFEFVDVEADTFFIAIIDESSGLVQVRASAGLAETFAETWLTDLALALDRDVVKVTISQGDFDALMVELEAGLVRYGGKDASGTEIDTVDVRVSPDFDDMSAAEAFKERTAGLEQMYGDLRFEVNDKKFTIRVSKVTHTIYFMTAATETTIAHVYSALRTVKVRHLKPAVAA